MEQTSVKTCGEDSEVFLVALGLYQIFALSFYLFTLAMEELTKHIQVEVSWCMMFVEHIVLVDETKDSVNTKLKIWSNALKFKGFK